MSKESTDIKSQLNKIQISSDMARQIAFNIIWQIDDYIENHQEEYNNFLEKEGTGNARTN